MTTLEDRVRLFRNSLDPADRDALDAIGPDTAWADLTPELRRHIEDFVSQVTDQEKAELAGPAGNPDDQDDVEGFGLTPDIYDHRPWGGAEHTRTWQIGPGKYDWEWLKRSDLVPSWNGHVRDHRS